MNYRLTELKVLLFLANARCMMKKTMKTESRKQIFL